MPPTCWKYVNCVTSMPSIQTSHPVPQAPSVGPSQLSSTKRVSCAAGSMPMASSERRYCSCTSSGEGFSSTWYW